jgi:dTDP-4-amino-4,6-dideoxygalactose transaminase
MIRLSKCAVGAIEAAAVQRVLLGAFLGTGPETQAFERELQDFLGGGVSVVCVNTGTAALHLALQACGVGPEDEVLAPSLTFLATFQSISATGARPVACDVLEGSGLIDLEDAAQRVTARTRAIMPVHYASYAGDLDAVYAFAKKHNLRVIEDAAHAFGCTYKGRRIGSFGDVICFSFDGIKNITSGEGGAVVSQDPEVIRRVRDARLLGVEKDTERRYARQRSWEFDVHDQGWRYHMSDLMAALGRVQLTRFENEFRPKRIALATRYRELLNGMQGVKLFETDLGSVVPHIQPIRVLSGKRDQVRAHLNASGIETGIHYKPNHLLARYGGGQSKLLVAELLHDELLSLPLHFDLSLSEVEFVVAKLRETIQTLSE